MTKYAVAHHDLATGELSLLIISDALNEVDACARALTDIDPSYDYAELAECADIDALWDLLSDEESITVLPV